MFNVQYSMYKYLIPLRPLFQPLQHAPAAAASFSEADIVRQRHVAGELQRKRQHLDAFVSYPAFVLFRQQFHLHGPLGFVAELMQQAHELVLQDLFEQGQTLHHAVEAGIERVVVFVEGEPVADVVAERLFPHAEGILLDVEPGDAHRRAAAVEVKRPVGLRKEVVEFLDAVVEAHEHGAAVILFVLDQRQAVVIAAGVVVVVVEKIVFPAGFASHGAAKGAQFPGIDRGVECDGQESYFWCHTGIWSGAVWRYFRQQIKSHFRRIPKTG